MRTLYIPYEIIEESFQVERGGVKFVKIPDGLPEEVSISPKHSGNVISIRFVYENNLTNKKIVDITPNLTGYLGENRVHGFDVSIKEFYSEIRNLIYWLSERLKTENHEETRINMKFIAVVMEKMYDKLLVPPQ